MHLTSYCCSCRDNNNKQYPVAVGKEGNIPSFTGDVLCHYYDTILQYKA